MIQQLKIIVFLFTCLVSYGVQTSAQDVAEAIPDRFKQYQKLSFQEKMYVHTDKSFYLAGEIIWFKVYNVDGTFHQPSDLSKVAYLEVLDKDNKPVMQGKIALKKGKGNGSFYLPASINSGNYRVRAYTNWMKNFSADYYFEKPVTIVNSLKPLTLPKPDTALRYYAAFFPEGGNLVNDVESKVAFKVTDRYGKGVACKGILLADNNDTLLAFNSQQFGMGHFSFTPQANRRYKAVIFISGGPTILQEMPAAYEQGFVMQLQEEPTGSIKIKVTGSKVADQSVFLFVHSRQDIKVAEKQTTVNGAITFTIDKNKLAEGISHITIFNAQQQPVCERLYFKRPAQVLSISASSSSAQYGVRKRVGVAIASKTTKSGVPADLSLAVYRLDSLQTIDPNSILSYMWLSSDLGGNIESPEYYFSDNSAEVQEATDNLVLVNGWRRFNWNDVLSNKPAAFEFIPEFDGHMINAKVVNSANEGPLEDVGTYLSVPGMQIQFYNAKTNAQGKAFFDVRDYYGQNEIILQTDAALQNYRIDVQNPFSEKYSSHPLPAFALSENVRHTVNQHSIGMQVINAYDGNKLSRFAIPAIDTTPFYGKPYSRYKLDDYTRFTTMEEVLREYVPEVAVRRRDGQLHLLVFDWELRDFYSPDPLILLDGVRVDNQTIMAYDPLKVNTLDVVTNKYIKGDFIYNGIVSFTTYHGDMQDLKLDPKAVILDYEGLQLQREFYSPVYKTEQQANSRLPDFRHLLYWSPTVQTDAGGQAALEFYTSDIKGRYVAVLQGMDALGNAGSYQFTFEVK
jgi:hypothetical protein